MNATTLAFRSIEPSDAEPLSNLTRASKASWGYDEEFMRTVDPELVVLAKDVTSGALRGEVATAGFELVGYFAFTGEAELLWLESLFVTPAWIRRGAGRALWERSLAFARELGARSFAFESDPNADRFYDRMGAVRTSAHASRVNPGRMLTLFRVTLSP